MFLYIISQSENKFAPEHLRRNKKTKTKKNERGKENHRRITNYFIGKYAMSLVRFCIAFVNIL